MSTIRDNIRNKIKHILENEKDENVLKQLNEDLTPYQLQLGRESNVYTRLRPDFTDKEVEEINEAFDRAKDPENLVPHEVVKSRIQESLMLRKQNA